MNVTSRVTGVTCASLQLEPVELEVPLKDPSSNKDEPNAAAERAFTGVTGSAGSFVNELDAQLRPTVGAGHFGRHHPGAHQDRDVRVEVHRSASRPVISDGRQISRWHAVLVP